MAYQPPRPITGPFLRSFTYTEEWTKLPADDGDIYETTRFRHKTPDRVRLEIEMTDGSKQHYVSLGPVDWEFKKEF